MKDYASKYKDNPLSNNECNTIDDKHKKIIKLLNKEKDNKDELLKDLDEINSSLLISDDINKKAMLLDYKENIEQKLKNIETNYNEMEYFDKIGDVISNYYEIQENKNNIKEYKNIIDFMKSTQALQNSKQNNKSVLLEKFCQIIDGVRIHNDDGTQRIKYCDDCKIEQILNTTESGYICQYCGNTESVILDEDVRIKDYSPYKRINHFREWLNQFQAKQTPDIPEYVFADIVKELHKNKVTDLSKLNKQIIKKILKKLNYNFYYEHSIYIIYKLNNLPPPRITRDTEKILFTMFLQIQIPWEIYKSPIRKNFTSYSYILRKFCELLELDHLIRYFSLHKDHKKIIENDIIWEKICKYLKWEYIPSN